VIVREGLSLDVYPSRAVPAYAELAAELTGLCVHATLPPSRLLAVLPQFERKRLLSDEASPSFALALIAVLAARVIAGMASTLFIGFATLGASGSPSAIWSAPSSAD